MRVSESCSLAHTHAPGGAWRNTKKSDTSNSDLWQKVGKQGKGKTATYKAICVFLIHVSQQELFSYSSDTLSWLSFSGILLS